MFMKRVLKNGTALALAVVLTSSSVMAASANTTILANNVSNFAVQGIDVNVTDINGIRTATTTDAVSEYTVVYNQIDNTIQLNVKDLKTGTVSRGSVESINKDTTNPIMQLASNVHQDTFCNFEYDVWFCSQDEWNL